MAMAHSYLRLVTVNTINILENINSSNININDRSNNKNQYQYLI